MSDLLQAQPHLIIDAAGPETIVGISHNGDWRACERSKGPTMESLRDLVQKVLQSYGQPLQSLAGATYAEGPGSTLGLRLAAIFLETLFRLPQLTHWNRATYNNLEMGAASLLASNAAQPLTLYAPWKKGCFHRLRDSIESKGMFHLDIYEGEFPGEAPATFIEAGLKRQHIPANAIILSYPVEDIPALLRKYPQLLRIGKPFKAYTPKQPEFAKWEGKRHTVQ